MNGRPSDAALAAIAAAYAVVMRARAAATPAPIASMPRWRLAGRVALADAASARDAARRSPWRSAIDP